MLIRRLTIFTLFFLSTATIAEPAPYYWWVSRLDGNRVCNQFLPGEGWIQEPKPFRDARCRVPL